MTATSRFHFTPADLTRAMLRLAKSATAVRVVSAWATEVRWLRDLPNCALTDKKAIIGVSYAHTAPLALRQLLDWKFQLRVVERVDDGGILHSKMYMFCQEDNTWTAFMGSANLTQAAFACNAEVMIETKLSDEQSAQLLQWFDGQWNSMYVTRPGRDWLRQYVERYRAAAANSAPGLDMPQAIEEAAASISRTITKGGERSLLRWDWRTYYRAITSCVTHPNRDYLDRHEGPSYFHTLETTRPILVRGLERASREELSMVLGIGGKCEFLGRNPLRTGRARMVHRDRELRAAVDRHVDPLRSASSSDAVMEAAEELWRRLRSIGGFGPGFITRILSILRPDRFYALNNASSARLAGLFELHKSQLTEWRGYRHGLDRVFAAPWYTAPEPTDSRELRVWANRVALIDVYVYDPQ